MKTSIQIAEVKDIKDYFPALFANKDKSIIIFADSKTSERTFSGMVIHAPEKAKNSIGTYDTGWTYEQFKRLSKGTSLTITIEQDNG